MQKDSSIQDFRDWKKMRKIFKRSPEILTQLSSTFSYTVKLFLRHKKKKHESVFNDLLREVHYGARSSLHADLAETGV